MNRSIFIIVLVMAIGIWACDTADNIAPLDENFFVKFYAGISEGDQFGEDIIATTDGGLLIAATSRNTDGSSEIILVKTDAKGNEVWTYGASALGPTSVAKSVIELPGGYLVGGTMGVGNGRRSILVEINYDGTFSDSTLVLTDDAGTSYWNQLSKITLGQGGILVSGETFVPAVTAGDINGFMGLFDLALNPILKGGKPNAYFGLAGDDIITGAYEVITTTSSGTKFLAFGSSEHTTELLTKGYDFFLMDFDSDFGVINDIDVGRVPKDGNQASAFITREEGKDEFWMIGETVEPSAQMFMIGWIYNASFWDTKHKKGDIGNSPGVTGKGIAVQKTGQYVIVGDEVFDPGVHSEIHLSRVDQFGSINDPWPKRYGANTATYSASAVVTLQDGSIIMVGTADLQPIKKIIVIKTGPNGEMSF